jgi:regulator of sirC expression with transglutaminase-like and TPR domain
MQLPRFEDLAASADATLDLLALALAAAFRPVEAARALATLDGLGAEVTRVLHGSARTPRAEALALSHVLGAVHGFTGDTEQYDRPENSMLDRVLESRRGLPILLGVVYVEVARRAGVELAGVGLPGHFVVGHFGADPPFLIDPFAGGAPVDVREADPLVRPWSPHETAMRMLNNVVGSYQRRGDIGRAIRAGELRLALPAEESLGEALRADLRAMRARLN